MQTNSTVKMDQKKSDEFSQKMLTILNHGALSLMLSIGYRTGLIDVMASIPPSTAKQIAEAGILNERYVREWLGAMVTGKIIEYNPEDKTYHLPKEHAVPLTRASEMGNFAVTMQWMQFMGYVEDDIVECFDKNSRVPDEMYNRFNEIMADQGIPPVAQPLLENLLPFVDGLKEKLQKGIDVVDIGCTNGLALIKLAKHYPNSRFVGYEISEEAFERAIAIAQEERLDNIYFINQNAEEINEKKKYDVVLTFDIIHDQANLHHVFANIYQALKDEGVYFMQDISGSSYLEKNMGNPMAPFLYTVSCTHCVSTSLVPNGAGLGTMWGKEKAMAMLKEAGFNAIEVKQLKHDLINCYYIVRK